MIILEFKNIELDFCPACEGCWLDRGELGLILHGEVHLPEDWEIRHSGKSGRRCPRCNGKMKTGSLPGTPVEVDECVKAHGLWLDKGELQEVLNAKGDAVHATALAKFVAGVFGTKEESR
jgi:hypothetical protein